MKACLKCGLLKTVDSFYKHKTTKDRLYNYCKDCCNVLSRTRYLKNPEKHKESNRQWNISNLKKRRELSRSWNVVNSDKANAKNARHRAKLLRATPKWAEFEQPAIKEMYALAKCKTKETGIKYHVDHIVPLNSDIVQGLHCLANLQVIEAKTNIIKGNRAWPGMP